MYKGKYLRLFERASVKRNCTFMCTGVMCGDGVWAII